MMWNNTETEQVILYNGIRKALTTGGQRINSKVDELKNQYRYELSDIQHDIFIRFQKTDLMKNIRSDNIGGYIKGTTDFLLGEILDKNRNRRRLRENNAEIILEGFNVIR